MQFRISTLFWATLVVAASLALAGAWGFLPAVYWIVGLWWWAAPRYSNDRPRRTSDDVRNLVLLIVCCWLCVVCPAGVFLDGVDSRARSRRTQCQNNLSRIARALESYRATHGRLPPAVVLDSAGQPAHSWRTLLLSDLDRPDLFQRCDFRQPWNSAANATISGTPLPVFQCPSDSSSASAPSDTNYLAIVGPGTVWDAHASPDASNLRIMLVEVAQSGIGWAEPKDVTAEEFLAAFGQGEDEPSTIRSPHPGFFHVAYADGPAQWIPTSAPRALVQTLLYEGFTTQAETELDKLDTHRREYPLRHFWWRMAAWVVSITAFGVHAFRFRRGPPLSPANAEAPIAAPGTGNTSSSGPAAPPA